MYSQFLQSSHLHKSEQITPYRKHSQYFFWHPDRLQLQPLKCLLELSLRPSVYSRSIKTDFPWVKTSTSSLSTGYLILLLKANGFLIKIYSLAWSLLASCSFKLEQQLHLHPPPQYLLFLKHSQYNFKHPEFEQLQGLWASVSSYITGDNNTIWLFSSIFVNIYLAISAFWIVD